MIPSHSNTVSKKRPEYDTDCSEIVKDRALERVFARLLSSFAVDSNLESFLAAIVRHNVQMRCGTHFTIWARKKQMSGEYLQLKILCLIWLREL